MAFACVANFDSVHKAEKALDSLRVLNKVIKFECIEKIKTTNATYMAASGLDPKDKLGADIHGHPYALCDYALLLKEALRNISDHDLKLRAGISCGPLVGVIGACKPVYDIWGNTVNEASRMESTGDWPDTSVRSFDYEEKQPVRDAKRY